MPDRYFFEHLTSWGAIRHRCIECGFPDPPRPVPEAERAAHAKEHEQARKKAVKRNQQQAAAHARKMRKLAARENEKAYD